MYHDQNVEKAAQKNTFETSAFDSRAIQKLVDNKFEYKASLVLLILLHLIETGVSIYLLLGVYKRNAKFLKVYLLSFVGLLIASFVVQFFVVGLVTPAEELLAANISTVLLDGVILGKAN